MWIQITRTGQNGLPITRRLKLRGMSATVVFSTTGKAQVTDEVGDYLVDLVDQIIASDSSNQGDPIFPDQAEHDLITISPPDGNGIFEDIQAETGNIDSIDTEQATFADTGSDPDEAGEIQRSGPDLKAYTGGVVVNLSNIGTGGGLDAEGVRDLLGTVLEGGDEITVTPDDPNDTITIDFSGSHFSSEEARDALANAFSGTGIDITHDDPNDTITLSLADGSVDSAKLTSSAVTTGKIADSAVTLPKIDGSGGEDGEVMTAKGDGSVVFDPLPSGGGSSPGVTARVQETEPTDIPIGDIWYPTSGGSL